MTRKSTKPPRKPACDHDHDEGSGDEVSMIHSLNALMVRVGEFNRDYEGLIEQQSELLKELNRLRRCEQQRIRQQRFREKQRGGRDTRRYMDDVCPTCGN